MVFTAGIYHQNEVIVNYMQLIALYNIDSNSVGGDRDDGGGAYVKIRRKR